MLFASVVFAQPRFTVSFLLAVGTLLFAPLVYDARWLLYAEFVELSASIGSVLHNP